MKQKTFRGKIGRNKIINDYEDQITKVEKNISSTAFLLKLQPKKYFSPSVWEAGGNEVEDWACLRYFQEKRHFTYVIFNWI